MTRQVGRKRQPLSFQQKTSGRSCLNCDFGRRPFRPLRRGFLGSAFQSTEMNSANRSRPLGGGGTRLFQSPSTLAQLISSLCSSSAPLPHTLSSRLALSEAEGNPAAPCPRRAVIPNPAASFADGGEGSAFSLRTAHLFRITFFRDANPAAQILLHLSARHAAVRLAIPGKSPGAAKGRSTVCWLTTSCATSNK